MGEHASEGPSICLNMIVRNEAHIVREILDATAPYISSWVIVDTGSTDGTQTVITEHMNRLGIPGELHERPWVDFGHNRTEALQLAQGKADYIWVIDADDILEGTPDLANLTADVYAMLNVAGEQSNATFWRTQIFRDGLPIRYEGVIHEQPASAVQASTGRVEGNYRVVSRRLGSRDRDQDTEVLLAAVERNPEDSRSVLHLAQTYLGKGDLANARTWLVRRTEMGGSEEEIFVARHQLAGVLAALGSPWPEIRDALMDAWECRPTRAEPLYELAQHYRAREKFELGYRFAKIAASIPYPQQDTIVMQPEVYVFRATEEQVACAAALGAYPEVFSLCRELIARPMVPEADRQRITGNRDQAAPHMAEAAAQYPDALIPRLQPAMGSRDVLVTLVAGPDLRQTERTLNSFLNCCTDVSNVGRFVVDASGLSEADRAALRQRYGFLEFGPATQARFRLDLGEGWTFFAPDNLLTRLISVLNAEPSVARVGINYRDATGLTGISAPEAEVRRRPGTGRYVIAPGPITGPAMTDTTRSGTGCATLDEVLCIGNPKAAPEPARTPSRYIAL